MDWGSFILLVSPSLLIGGLVHALCLSFPEQRDPGSCPETRSPYFVPRNCGTPFYTQNLPFQKAAVTLPGSSLISDLLSRSPSLSAHHLGAQTSCYTAGIGSLCVGCLLYQMCSACCDPLVRLEGISVYFGAVGLSAQQA